MAIPMCIPLSVLRPADIIVTTTNHPTSRAIRAATGGPVSHAMLFLGGARVAEAIGSGTREAPISSAFNEATLAIALRRKGITELQAEAVVQHARAIGNAHRPYDQVGAVGAGMTRNNMAAACIVWAAGCMSLAAAVAANARAPERDLKFFCSELVARSFQLAGIPLFEEDPSFTNPREILESKLLEYQGHLIGG